MKVHLTLFIGVFAIMALSNAIVPVLPSFASTSFWQGAIYSAYFLGAFATTLPGGILSDRHGKVPVMRAGLVLTVLSGMLLSVTTNPAPVLLFRGLEGAGAGLFIASAMACVNSRPNHMHLSGYFMAMLNVGLVFGLIASGWLAVKVGYPATGIILFTILSLVPAVTSLFIRGAAPIPSGEDVSLFWPLVRGYRWIWYSSVILVGITGVISSLYPKFSSQSPEILGIWIGSMSIATIITVVAISRMTIRPVPAIRWSAILMIPGVFLSYISPLGFVVLGALAGIVMIAQMAVLAGIRDQQGAAMGLFSTSSYLGMTVLPVVAGIIADSAGFFCAFLSMTFFAATVAVTIGRGNFRNPDSAA
jgi:MFS family permease